MTTPTDLLPDPIVDLDDLVVVEDAPSSASRWSRMKATFQAMPLLVKASTIWLIFIFGGAIYGKIDDLVGQVLPLQDPFYQGSLFNEAKRLETPSTSHVLGTDNLSRDIFARVLHGGWVSLTVAMAAVLTGIIIGGLLGSYAGFRKGKRGTVIMAMIDVILAFPALILLLAIVSVWENRSLGVIALVIALLSIPPYTRVARATSLAISKREFVTAAEAIGTKPMTILLREVIPNVLPILLAYALVAAGAIIVIEGSLSFLGLSVPPPQASWGNMINEARADIRVTIMPAVWPALALTLTVLALNQVGDWMQRRAGGRSSAFS
ncbi:MAG: ABC transporter permease [Acidimicrobiia bacterium]|nr:ABC transporter permease [Acidimicrobiia bacterium]